MLDDEYLPDCQQLKQKIEDLVKVIWDIGPNARQEAIEANGYQTVIDAWKLFCDTGEDDIRILAYGSIILSPMN